MKIRITNIISICFVAAMCLALSACMAEHETSDGMHDYSIMLSNIPSSSAFIEGCAAFAKYIYCELE